MTDLIPTESNRADADKALLLLLVGIVGPNYAGALNGKDDISAKIERCIVWVKGEASEAASLIESCVPHGKPTLAQAQKRLESLEALETLQSVTAQFFGDH